MPNKTLQIQYGTKLLEKLIGDNFHTKHLADLFPRKKLVILLDQVG